jgi:hypothetical protein
LSTTFDLEDFNMLDMNAKKVLEALAESRQGTFVKGVEIHKKTGLIPEDINLAIMSLRKSLLVEVAANLESLPPYNFYGAMITDFGRQVLKQFS